MLEGGREGVELMRCHADFRHHGHVSPSTDRGHHLSQYLPGLTGAQLKPRRLR